MAKVETYPWDPADVIETGEDAIHFLEASVEDFDPNVFGALMDCIARSQGVAEIADASLNEPDAGQRSVTVTTTSGASTTIPIAPDVNADAILQALLSQRPAKPVRA